MTRKGNGTQAPKSCPPPKFSRRPTLDTQLILRKISKSDATNCQILRLKCRRFDFHYIPQTPLGFRVRITDID